MDKINVAVIGTGSMGKNHARVYSEMPHANLVAVCDSNKEAAKEIAGRYKTNCYSDYKEMLEKEKLDAASLCVPTKLHKQVAIDLIKNKIGILVEKPIATTIEEAGEIIDAAKKNKVKLMVGHIERFNPVITELKKRIEGNELGKIINVDCERLSLFPQRIIDVGVTVDLAIHEIDILKYLIGSKIKRVYAETAQRFHSSHEDLLIGTVRFENSILGVISTNWLTPKKVREIKVTGEKGMFVANYLTQELYFYEKEFAAKEVDYNKGFIMGKEGKKIKVEIKNEEPLKNELSAFIGCIKNNKEPPVTGKDGLDALYVAQKFLESAKKNKVIEL
ncbi:Gfo/Idh/MocA family oxidoreductase [Candidatus Woesearchaeota archaeon]|nr:Gfo/Idh/MocA family oxidoreductase [Candidatus Woesearchaeota archaeon]